MCVVRVIISLATIEKFQGVLLDKRIVIKFKLNKNFNDNLEATVSGSVFKHILSIVSVDLKVNRASIHCVYYSTRK